MKRHQQGFTLAELMVSITLGMIIIAGVLAVLVSSAGIYRSSDSRARIQENARFAMGLLQEDLRMAGYMGCFNLTMFPTRFTNLVKNPADYGNDYQLMVNGHEASATAWSPTINASIGSTTVVPVKGSDVLVLRGPVGPSAPLNDTMTTTSAPIPLASVEGFTVGGLAIISDCGYANVFKVTQIPANKKLVHAANMNTDAKLTRVFSNLDGAVVTPLGTVSYFVAPAGDGVSGNRSLYRQEGTGTPEEIATGIEQMQLEYGVDTDGAAGGAANKFVTADQIGTLTVSAVKVSLLVTTYQINTAMKAQTYNFNGSTVTASDKRLYAPVTTTVTLRNRVL
jgi:type IV pilus assembly protein PilW